MDSEPKLINGTNAAEKIMSLWRNAENRSGVTLILHDHVGAFIMPDKTKILPGVNTHKSPCCQYRKGSRKKCMLHCRLKAMETAAATGNPCSNHFCRSFPRPRFQPF